MKINVPSFDEIHVLIGKVMAPRSIRQTEIEPLFRNIWTPKRSVIWKPPDDNVVIISFTPETNYLRVLKSCQWLFVCYLFAIERVNPKSIIAHFQPLFCPFQVQIHGLLSVYWIYPLPIVGNEICEFVEADTDKDGGMLGHFMRIKVDLFLPKPLHQHIVVTQHGIDTKYQLSYERLPLFRFFCGHLNHSDKDCDTRLMTVLLYP